ncbi:MAG: transcriptional regulator with cupin sensor, AraC family [Clostridiales bacterium]|jgi:AraC-like DNA-binding protein|nr:transcriptional regulator with cupin sensor, AraC family [Clostridiales bacterium]
MNYFEEQKATINGVPYNFFCHVEECNGPGLLVNAHLHDYIEILYGITGVFDVYLNGNRHTFQVGDMVLINSQEVHQIVSLSEGSGQYIVIRFEPEIIYTMSQSVFESKYVLPFTLNNSTHQKVFKNFEIVSTFIPGMLQEILFEFINKDYGFELAIKAHICKIFLWILRYWHKAGVELNIYSDTSEELYKKLQIVFYFVSENYEKDIKALDMAKLCNMSYSYFSRSFNNVMKTSFNEYLNYVRITEAEKLLISTDLNITEIAMAVGFSTASYFIKQFKLYKNFSPKQFKKNFVF